MTRSPPGGGRGPDAARVAAMLLIAAGAAGCALGGGGGAAALALLAGGLAMLPVGWMHAAERRRRADRLVAAWERLSPLRAPGEVIACAEAIGRTLLPCESVRLTLAPSAGPGPDGVAVPGADGETLGWIGVVRAGGAALTAAERRVLEPFARAVGAALQRSVWDAKEGVLLLDGGWRIQAANAAAAGMLRCRPGDMPGAELWALLPGLREGVLSARLAAAAAGTGEAAFTGFHAPANAWLELRVQPFAGGLAVHLRDVTLQWETEQKLREVQRLEAIGQLTGGVAHDVNNLLTVILGNLELLAMRAEDRLAGVADAGEDPRLDVTLAEAGVRAGESASQLMHRLLAFSRRQPAAPQVVAVDEVLRSLQPLLRRTLSEQVSLRMHWPAGLWHALVDPAELESAILNLAINAQDAMPGGGTLTIAADNVAADTPRAVPAGPERPGETIVISVTDTGTGMPTEVLARAFDPFFTTKAAGKGTGLGLSMVAGFARQSRREG